MGVWTGKSLWLKPPARISPTALFLRLLVAFGVVFELPVVLGFLARAGLVTHETLKKYRKYVVLGIFLVAALLTPPDVFTQVALALPLWGLYEVTLLWIRLRRAGKS